MTIPEPSKMVSVLKELSVTSVDWALYIKNDDLATKAKVSMKYRVLPCDKVYA